VPDIPVTPYSRHPASCRRGTAPFWDRCNLVRGDLLRLPFATGTFGVCRIDLVLQHIHSPAHVIEELFRVLAPGGTLVAFDNDGDRLKIRWVKNESYSCLNASIGLRFAACQAG